MSELQRQTEMLAAAYSVPPLVNTSMKMSHAELVAEAWAHLPVFGNTGKQQWPAEDLPANALTAEQVAEGLLSALQGYDYK